MRIAVSLGLAVALLGACGKSKPPAETRSCRSAADCDEGWLCLASKRADPRGSAVYTDPKHAVTPDKVRDEVEQKVDDHEDDIEDRVDRAETEP
jgi:hypothetical protein